MPLNKDQIIEESLKLLNESGIEGVALRKLAPRLGVRVSALYWHFEKKEALITEMADTIVKPVFTNLEPGPQADAWQEWLIGLYNRLRKALLAYKDGGRVVAGAHLALTQAKITEIAIKTLLNHGLSLRRARLIVLTATHYTFGYVIEEQTPLPAESLQNFNLAQYRQEYPLTVAAIEEYFGAGRTADELFNDGLKIIVGEQV